jgi:hypothetical protein
MKDIFQFKKVIDLRFNKQATFAAIAAITAICIPAMIVCLKKRL